MKNLVKMLLLLFSLAVTCFAAEGNCIARDISTRPDCQQAIQFLERLQEAIRSDQPVKVAALIQYPLRTSLGGKRTLVRSKQQFLSKYRKIFTPAVRCAVLSSKSSDVWGNANGFMIAAGTVWWDAIIPAPLSNSGPPDTTPGKYPLKVITVNNAEASKQDCPEATSHSAESH